MNKPTYEELADAFAEYLAQTSNAGDVPFDLWMAGVGLTDEDRDRWLGSIARAAIVVDAAGGTY